jgi:hypothetical protein
VSLALVVAGAGALLAALAVVAVVLAFDLAAGGDRR